MVIFKNCYAIHQSFHIRKAADYELQKFLCRRHMIDSSIRFCTKFFLTEVTQWITEDDSTGSQPITYRTYVAEHFYAPSWLPKGAWNILKESKKSMPSVCKPCWRTELPYGECPIIRPRNTTHTDKYADVPAGVVGGERLVPCDRSIFVWDPSQEPSPRKLSPELHCAEDLKTP